METLLKDLIELVTGSRVGSKPFNRSVNAVNNIRRNTYGSPVCKFEVEKAIQGLEEKFIVHSQKQRAERLSSLCQFYLDKHSTELDFSTSVLWFLIRLAHNPTSNSPFEPLGAAISLPSLGEDVSETSTTEISVTSIHVQHPSNAPESSSELSDWSTDEEELFRSASSECQSLNKDEVVPWGYKSKLNGKVNVLPSSVELGAISRKWLHDNLQPSYWKRITWDGSRLKQHTSNLRQSWEAAFSDTVELSPFGGAIEMSERQVCREILWLLQGRMDVIICDWKPEVDGFVVNEHICVSHLTRASLNEKLARVNQAANVLRQLQLFVDNCATNSEPVFSTRTFSAFAFSLQQFLKTVLLDLSLLEKNIIVQKESVTLLSLLEDLKPNFVLLHDLGNVFVRGIVNGDSSWTPYLKCAHLLNVIFEAAVNFEQLQCSNSEAAKLMICVFLKTVRPYIEILDTWVSTGRLSDPFNEFILCGNNATLDENFWDSCISIRSGFPGIADADAISFLKEVLYRISVIGRSVELLRNLSKGNIIAKEGCALHLYWLVVKSFDLTECAIENIVTPKAMDAEMLVFSSYLNCLDSSDDIFSQLGDHFFQKNSFSSNNEPNIDECIYNYLTKKSSSFSLTFLSSLHMNFEQKSNYICKRLYEVLIENYDLMSCLNALRKYFLFNAGEIMFQFCVNIFSNVSNNSLNLSEMDLNLLLEDVLSACSSSDVSKLSVSVRNEESSACNSVFEKIFLRYKVDWPLNTIVNSYSQYLLDGAFSFLLNIKNAKYQLERLRFGELWGGVEIDSDVNCQKMLQSVLLLRFRLVCLIGTMHDYIHTHILFDSEELLLELHREAFDFQKVIDGYRQHLQVIRERSFSSPNFLPIRKVIFAITTTVSHFATCWTQSIHHFNWPTLIKMKNDVDASLDLLINIIKTMNESDPASYLGTFLEVLKSSL